MDLYFHKLKIFALFLIYTLMEILLFEFLKIKVLWVIKESSVFKFSNNKRN